MMTTLINVVLWCQDRIQIIAPLFIVIVTLLYVDNGLKLRRVAPLLAAAEEEVANITTYAAHIENTLALYADPALYAGSQPSILNDGGEQARQTLHFGEQLLTGADAGGRR